MASKKGLGRGLGALLDANSVIETTTETEKDVKKIKITQIEPNKTQPRTAFDEEKIEELAERIMKEYEGKELTFICILKGSVLFTVDLAKKIKN